MLAMLHVLKNFWEFPSSLIFTISNLFIICFNFKKTEFDKNLGGLHPIILSLYLNTEYFRWKKLIYSLVIYFCFSTVKLIFFKGPFFSRKNWFNLFKKPCCRPSFIVKNAVLDGFLFSESSEKDLFLRF